MLAVKDVTLAKSKQLWKRVFRLLASYNHQFNPEFSFHNIIGKHHHQSKLSLLGY